jgi:hypothetical protein
MNKKALFTATGYDGIWTLIIALHRGYTACILVLKGGINIIIL